MSSSRWVDFKEVKAAVSIRQVLDHFGIEYREVREGKLTLACPIHEGSNPRAFHVDVEKGTFKCFTGCRKGGNVLDLMMELEDLPIREAALKLQELFMGEGDEDRAPARRRARSASTRSGDRRRSSGGSRRSAGASGRRAGRSPSRRSRSGARRAQTPSRRRVEASDEQGGQHERDEVDDLHQEDEHDQDGDRGDAGARGRRTAARPPRASGLRRPARAPQGRVSQPDPNPPLSLNLPLRREHPYLEQRGIGPQAVAEFGLGYCPRGILAGRIAIPIHNPDGELVAYAGRHPKGKAPRYKFPSGFHKSLELYNLHRAKHEAAAHGLVVVEGFFDVIVLWQLGVPNAVALMGTELSTAQEALLVQHTNRVILLLDGDEAGRSAAQELLPRLATRLFVKTVELPDGVQPDSLEPGGPVLKGLMV